MSMDTTIPSGMYSNRVYPTRVIIAGTLAHGGIVSKTNLRIPREFKEHHSVSVMCGDVQTTLSDPE